MPSAKLTVALLVVTICCFAIPAEAQTAVFLVRHAERADQSEDADLSREGLTRAARLARLLEDAGITAIYTSERRRTIKTAQPLAREIDVTPRTMPARDTKALIKRIRGEHATDKVLIVGHSNTVPDILEAFGHPQPVKIADDEYDNLFLLVPRPAGAPVVIRLRY